MEDCADGRDWLADVEGAIGMVLSPEWNAYGFSIHAEHGMAASGDDRIFGSEFDCGSGQGFWSDG